MVSEGTFFLLLLCHRLATLPIGPSPSSPSLCLWEGARSRLLAHPPRVALGKQADSGVDVTVDRLYLVFHPLTGLGFEMNFWGIPPAGWQLM